MAGSAAGASEADLCPSGSPRLPPADWEQPEHPHRSGIFANGVLKGCTQTDFIMPAESTLVRRSCWIYSFIQTRN